ncbi:hypothetical protein ALC60_02566, partial [Trachymyrmex zeteki]
IWSRSTTLLFLDIYQKYEPSLNSGKWSHKSIYEKISEISKTSDSTQAAVSFLFAAIFQHTITPSSPPDKSKRSTFATCFESDLNNISDQPKFLKEFFACALTGVPEVRKRCLGDHQCPKR